MFGNHTPASVNDKRQGGTQWKFDYPNGFGASVINDGYGGDRGLYEIGVLQGGSLTYDTPLTDDVLGYLTLDTVIAALDEIEALTTEAVIEAATSRANADRDRKIAELRAELAALEAEVAR